MDLQTSIATGHISAVANQELVGSAETRDGAFTGLVSTQVVPFRVGEDGVGSQLGHHPLL
jgi:hypothetical protein